jgi:diguanylate cyclase (GGDEF)-like protein
MATHLECRRVLVAARGAGVGALRALLGGEAFAGWEAVEADTFERARFMLHMDPCDVVLLDQGLYNEGDALGVAWLAAQHRAPVLFLADAGPEVVAGVLHRGARQWLPRDAAFRHPELLAATLHQVAEVGELERRARGAADSLHEARLQVSRLVGLLWDAAPGGGRRDWFSQRYMMGRLEEEVSRSQRHGDPLALVLGEVQPADGKRVPADEAGRLAEWTAGQVTQGKRRCDVAGQYGPHGFMLLLPHTPDTGAVLCCRRLRGVLERPQVTPSGPLPHLHASFGVVSFSSAMNTVKGLLSRAEERLERAKAAGGGGVEF